MPFKGWLPRSVLYPRNPVPQGPGYHAPTKMVPDHDTKGTIQFLRTYSVYPCFIPPILCNSFLWTESNERKNRRRS